MEIACDHAAVAVQPTYVLLSFVKSNPQIESESMTPCTGLLIHLATRQLTRRWGGVLAAPARALRRLHSPASPVSPRAQGPHCRHSRHHHPLKPSILAFSSAGQPLPLLTTNARNFTQNIRRPPRPTLTVNSRELGSTAPLFSMMHNIRRTALAPSSV